MFNRIVRLLFFFYSISCFPVLAYADSYDVLLFKNKSDSVTVYYGETAYIPFEVSYVPIYRNMTIYSQWYLPPGLFVISRTNTPDCQGLVTGIAYYDSAFHCDLLLGIPGNQISVNTQTLYLELQSIKRKRYYYASGHSVQVRVIPHPYSLSIIPDYSATVGVPFEAQLQKHINYYMENLNAGIKAQVNVTPREQNGFIWDGFYLAMNGIPTTSGTFTFYLTTPNNPTPVPMRIIVYPNPGYMPVLNAGLSPPSGTPGKLYQFNLLDLLQKNADVNQSNATRFYIDKHYAHPDWLHINPENSTMLEGQVPASAAGQTVHITVSAESNRGGASKPLTLSIPVAWDLAKKPSIRPGVLEEKAGTVFHADLTAFIHQTEAEDNLTLIIEKIEPAINWLAVSASSPLTLEGQVPEDATGKQFQISVKVNSIAGGDSDTVIFPLQIAIDPDKKPRFQSGKPQLPLLYENLPWIYDFLENADIFPYYQEEPWKIWFAENHSYPGWLRLENNKLIAERVPADLPAEVCLWVELENVPGGKSNPEEICLRNVNSD